MIYLKNYTSLLIIVGLLIACNMSAHGQMKDSDSELKARQWVKNQMQLGFEENKGQMVDMDGKPTPYVLFKAETPNIIIWVTNKGLTYQFLKMEEAERDSEENHEEKESGGEKIKGEWQHVDMVLKNASIKKENIITQDDITQGNINYFLTHCPDGIFNVKTYSKITIKEVYPGIDWVLYTSLTKQGETGRGLKHDFIVHPHADPKQIKLVYEGSGKLKVNRDQIEFENDLGKVTEGELLCYQESRSNTISSHYTIKKNYSLLYSGAGNAPSKGHSALSPSGRAGEGLFSYEIAIKTGKYDPNDSLVIDPQLVWATFYGGSGVDGFQSVATDNVGNVLVTGYSTSANYPVQSSIGAYYQGIIGGGNSYGDVVIVKFNNTGVRLWATYYGGTGDDMGHSITADAGGNVFVTGRTGSGNFPVFNPFGGAYFQGTGGSMFILKFDNTGNRLWATYYGSGVANSITTDSNGNIFVTGNTSSANFPVCNTCAGYFQGYGGNGDVFILKFNNNGVRLWATFYGGSTNAIALSGNGFSGETGFAITTDNNGNVFVSGTTLSDDFPVCSNCPGYFQGTLADTFRNGDVFILKFDNSGNRLWATYYGGYTGDYGYSIATDASGNVFVSGTTGSNDFPLCTTCPGYFSNTPAFGHDTPFILKFDNSGNRLWATYYGKAFTTLLTFDNLAVDSCGTVYMSFSAPYTNANGPAVPITTKQSCDVNGYYDSTYNGDPNITGSNYGADIFITQFSNTGDLLWATYFGGDGLDYRSPIAVDNAGSLFVGGEWTAYTINSILSNPNVATYPLTNPGGGAYYNGTFNGGQDDSFIAKFKNIPLTLTTSSVNAGCSCSGSATVTPNGGCSATYSYLWNTGQTGQTITGVCAGNYLVTVSSSGCIDKTTSVTVSAGSGLSVTATQSNAACNGGTNATATVTVSGGVLPYTYLWSPSAGGQNTPTATGLSSGVFTVTITDAAGCMYKQTVIITQPQPLSLFFSTTWSCPANAGTATVNVGGGTLPYTYLWSNGQTVQTPTGLNAGVTYSVTITDVNGCTINGSVPIVYTPLALIPSSTNISCSTFGSAAVTIASGKPGYNYTWTNGQLVGSTIGLTAGNYTVTVTDDRGCTATQNFTITGTAPLSADFTQSPGGTVCKGTTVNFTHTGSGSPTNYAWTVSTIPYSGYAAPPGGWYGNICSQCGRLFSNACGNRYRQLSMFRCLWYCNCKWYGRCQPLYLYVEYRRHHPE
ncbi:MAG: SBBP repeat-containing protein [Bacteroidetes bacterium]|nr:SBBP repeat-containing protein [Bacteroidota bacterium]